jgi:hypothetical protein
MKVYGQVKNGLVVPDAGSALPEGARVVIEILTESESKAPPTAPDPARRERAFMKFAGIIDDLPEDAFENVDHYLYGHPKK